MKIRFFILFILFYSCEPIEIIEPVVFDNSQLKIITISAENLEINQLYETKFADPYIDHSMGNPPVKRLKSRMNENIVTIGNENKLKINILDASLKKTEQNNEDAKKFDEKVVYKYELFFLVEYNLFDNAGFLIANTAAEGFRSTTSGKYISIQETEKIIDDLILLSLIDFTNESKKLIDVYMKGYIL